MSRPHREIKIEDYDYDLPETRIPKYPLEKRDESKLLVHRNGQSNDAIFADLPDYLPKDSLLVFNDSKVIPVRFHFKNATGATIEVFCLEPIEEKTSRAIWKCFIGKRKKWKEQKLTQTQGQFNIEIEIVQSEKDYYLVEFSWNSSLKDMEDVFQRFGSIPIPPYLKRETEDIDYTRYQNVFAQNKGSVAAPTAGLHFTNELLNKLKETQIKSAFVSLHVGAGTFKPVKSETLGGHEMHREHMLITSTALMQMLHHINAGYPITAVGTTSLRTIESTYWLGNKLAQNETLSPSEFIVQQWTPYENEVCVSVQLAIQTILDYLKKENKAYLEFSTELLILPGYTFKMIDSLLTNFHQPKSTLLLIVSALLGAEWKSVYNHAMKNDYRFLSYGDGSLLFLNKEA